MFLESRKKQYLAVALAALAAATMWFYVRKIVQPIQVAEAESLGGPRGNLSDLYPRWLGARELLLRGRNPYSHDVTLEIQRGYYGRELDPGRPNEPKDQARFVYPLYVVFLLEPFVRMNFSEVQVGAFWCLGLLGLLSVPFWEQVLEVRSSFANSLTAILLLLATYPFIQAVSLQQPVLLVLFFLAASFFARSRGWLFFSGALMAIATIKPQAVIYAVFLMLIWVSWNWKERQRWFWGFTSTMGVLLAASELLLPGWLPQFYEGLRAYQGYLANTAFLDLFLTSRWAWVGRMLISVAVVWAAWTSRAEPLASVASRRAICLSLVAAVCNSPNFGTYNQVLLVPGFLLVVEQSTVLRQAKWLLRWLSGLIVLLALWPWVTCAALIIVKFVFHADVFIRHTLQLPSFGILQLPLVTLALLLVLPTERHSAGRSLAAVPRGVSCVLSF